MTKLTNQGPRGTIKDAAIKWLTAVSHMEEAGSVGYDYKHILCEIRADFPNANTSTNSLRWYAVQIRNSERGYEGFNLPRRRPRSRQDAKS